MDLNGKTQQDLAIRNATTTSSHSSTTTLSDSIPPSNPAQSVHSLRPGINRAHSSGREEHKAPRHFSSIQFVPQIKLDSTASLKNVSKKGVRRFSSPPPPTLFTPRVSFDTFDNKDASDFSLTLIRKHKDYNYSKRSRTFLCGTDANDYSDTALEWLVDELVEDGDEVVCLRVLEKDSKEARELAGAGSSKEARYITEAQNMLEKIQEKNSDDRAINLILEFAIGKVHETIQHMIRIYEPALLVVGTRGRSLSGFQGLLPGSVSKYCLQHSPVPVIVVRPSSKRDKKKRKRLRDPARRGYRDILDKSEDVAQGGHLLDHKNRRSVIGADLLNELGKFDADEEARMVAEAIGYRPGLQGENPISKSLNARNTRSGSMGTVNSDTTTGTDLTRSPLLKPMRHADMKDMESSILTDDEELSHDDDDDDDSDSDYEPIPAYLQAQEEALTKARERAIKAEEEEKTTELERKEKEKNKVNNGGSGVKKKRKQTAEDYTGPGAGVLEVLDDLRALEKQGKKK